MKNHETRKECGFTLIELSIVMVIVGLAFAALINLYTTYNKQRVVTITSNNIAAAQAALQKYQDDNGFYPCPADPTDPIGRSTNCALPAPPGIKVVTGTGGREVRIGVMPIVDMSGETKLISGSQAVDGWRSRLTYAVTQGMALDATQFVAGQGAITVTDENDSVIIPNGNIIVLSHGEDGAGGYNTNGVAIAACPSGTKDAENCNDDAVFVAGKRSYAFGANYNDDFIEFTTATAVETTKACPSGSILRGLKSNGDLICTKDLSCPAGSAFVGLLGDGETPNCQAVTASCAATEALVSMTMGSAPVCVRNMPGDCPAGYVQNGTINQEGADFGKPNCLKILTSCPTNYVQVGTNADHSPICVPNFNTRCPDNMVQVGNNTDGTANCIAPNCPAGQYFFGVSGGSPMCSGDRTVEDVGCSDGEVVKSIVNGRATCGKLSSDKGDPLYVKDTGHVKGYSAINAVFDQGYAICMAENTPRWGAGQAEIHCRSMYDACSMPLPVADADFQTRSGDPVCQNMFCLGFFGQSPALVHLTGICSANPNQVSINPDCPPSEPLLAYSCMYR